MQLRKIIPELTEYIMKEPVYGKTNYSKSISTPSFLQKINFMWCIIALDDGSIHLGPIVSLLPR